MDLICAITLSPGELTSGKISSTNLERALVGFEKNGFVVINNGVNLDHLDKLQQRMVPESHKLYLQTETHRNFGPDTGNIQQEPVPYSDYLFEDIIANRFVTAITECLLGPNPHVRFYSANTAFKLTLRQPVHIDCDFEFQDHCFGICVNINLVETSSLNGATELWPGSHRFAKGISDELVTQALQKKAPHKGVQPSLPKGAILVRDFRLWHAGMPNYTDDPRIMLVTVQFPHWYRSHLQLKLPESAKPHIESFQKGVCIDVEYYDDDTDYLKGSHDHTFAQTY